MRGGPGDRTRVGPDQTDRAGAVFEPSMARYGTEVGEATVAKRIEDDAGTAIRLHGEWVPPWEA